MGPKRENPLSTHYKGCNAAQIDNKYDSLHPLLIISEYFDKITLGNPELLTGAFSIF